jgi:hypothetical protein
MECLDAHKVRLAWRGAEERGSMSQSRRLDDAGGRLRPRDQRLCTLPRVPAARGLGRRFRVSVADSGFDSAALVADPLKL